MRYRQLGKSSLQISEIGFGCMSLQEDQASTTKILHRAVDLGINFFDTADLYQKGINEEMIGKALKEKEKVSCSLQKEEISGGLMAADLTGTPVKNMSWRQRRKACSVCKPTISICTSYMVAPSAILSTK